MPNPKTVTLKKKLSTSKEECYEQVSLKNKFTLKIGQLGCRDNTVILKDKSIAIVTNIRKKESNIIIEVRRFLCTKPFFKKPVKSDSVGIFQVSNLGPKQLIDITNVLGKMVLVPKRNSYVAILMLHTL